LDLSTDVGFIRLQGYCYGLNSPWPIYWGQTLKKLFAAFFAVLVSAALVGAGWYLARAVPIGTGYVAKYLCSSTFMSGRDAETVFREDVSPVNPLAKIISYRIDLEGKSVTAGSLGLFKSVAVYREGCGCTLVRGVSPEELKRQPIGDAIPRKALPPDLPWPFGEGNPSPAPPGVDEEKLKGALDRAFAEEGEEELKRTRAVLVVYDGALIAERYAPGFHRDMPLLGWSMAKSLTNAIVGILVQKGKLRLNDLAPVPEWQGEGDPRRHITLGQLMRMSSGLRFSEVYEPLQDVTNMLYGSADYAAYAASKPLETQPGTKWSYSSGTANIIARIVRQSLEKEYTNYYQFIQEEFFDRVGMTSAVLEADPSGTFVGSSYAVATPRDWARFGLLFLQNGIWGGERLLPEGWVAYTTTPASQAPKGEYGALFWLNAGSEEAPQNRRWPAISPDAYSAEGYQYQRTIIMPSKKLVLVRFGATSGHDVWNTESFISDVLTAFP
jgi:CubicO group peptidase (beta-lactamase class C family)